MAAFAALPPRRSSCPAHSPPSPRAAARAGTGDEGRRRMAKAQPGEEPDPSGDQAGPAEVERDERRWSGRDTAPDRRRRPARAGLGPERGVGDADPLRRHRASLGLIEVEEPLPRGPGAEATSDLQGPASSRGWRHPGARCSSPGPRPRCGRGRHPRRGARAASVGGHPVLEADPGRPGDPAAGETAGRHRLVAVGPVEQRDHALLGRRRPARVRPWSTATLRAACAPISVASTAAWGTRRRKRSAVPAGTKPPRSTGSSRWPGWRRAEGATWSATAGGVGPRPPPGAPYRVVPAAGRGAVLEHHA